MARLVGDSGKIVAFEPARRTFDQLNASIRYSRAENIVARNVALGSASGRLMLRVPANVSGNASAYERAEEGAVQMEEVEVATLDAELSRPGDRPVRLIKLDAEGGELDILRGARQTLKSYTPGIIVEWNPETADLAGWKITELLDFVQECGPYQSKLIWHDGKLLSVDPRHIEIEPGGYVDLFLDAGIKP
jgi:FkbM family methyltransferase